jgi:TIR domain
MTELPSDIRIFVSYRRADTMKAAGRIYADLLRHFGGKEHVFQDVADIEPGVPWDEAIDGAVGSCHVFLVVIGSEWLTPRLEDENDRHRREIEVALERKIRVIPVLIDHARMPEPNDLPETLRKLQKIQAQDLDTNAFAAFMPDLIAVIERAAAQQEAANLADQARQERAEEAALGEPLGADLGAISHEVHEAQPERAEQGALGTAVDTGVRVVPEEANLGLFGAATEIVGSSGTTRRDNALATKEPGEPDHAGNDGGKSVWYRWTAPADGTATIDTAGSDFDTLLAVYRGSSVAGLELIAANDDTAGTMQSRVRFPIRAGLSYKIAVDGYGGAAGTIKLNWEVDPPLPNDDFSSAEEIVGASGTIRGDNTGATKEPGEPAHAGNDGGKSVWYRWTAPADGTVTIDTAGSDFDTLLAVYRGSSVAGLEPIAANDDAPGSVQSRLRFPIRQGLEYRIAVDGYGGATGTIKLNWEVDPPLPNDDFSAAEEIVGASGTIRGVNTGATKEPGEPAHAGNDGGTSVWYRWTAPASGSATIDTFGSDFDTLLAVYRGSSRGALEPIAANDDAPGTRQSQVRLPITHGLEYMIAVDGYAGAMGAITLNWQVNPPLPNDDFAGAEEITGPSGTIRGDNIGATKEPGEPDHAGNVGGASVWYRWTAPAGGSVTFDTFGSGFDTLLAVYRGSSLEALEEVAANDDAPGTIQSQARFPIKKGAEYIIAVDGYGGAAGSLVLNWKIQVGSGVFVFLALLVAIPAAIYAYSVESSIWLSVFVAAMAMQIIGRGLSQVVTHPRKLQRGLYYSLLPLISTAILYLAYQAWDRWWLAVTLGLAGGVLLTGILAPLLFRRIHREELAERANSAT